MKVISFSLFGGNPKYVIGALRNIHLARRHYPTWKCWFYIDRIPETVQELILEHPQNRILPIPDWCPPMFARFLVADDPAVERFIVRDCDSRIGPEEAAAVEEWIREDTILHTCRDHPAHCRPINGGLWGGVWRRHNWAAPSMEGLIRQFLKNNPPWEYGLDQDFLGQKVWPWAQNSCTQHASVCRQAYPGSKPFPVKWPHPRFMGEVYEVNPQTGEEHPRDHDWEAIEKE